MLIQRLIDGPAACDLKAAARPEPRPELPKRTGGILRARVSEKTKLEVWEKRHQKDIHTNETRSKIEEVKDEHVDHIVETQVCLCVFACCS